MLKKTVSLCLAAFLLAFSFSSCGTKQDRYQSRVLYTMDTVIELYISAKNDAKELLDECESLIYAIENKVSRTKQGSDIYILNETGNADCSEHTLKLLEISKTAYELSSGAYDPTVLPITELWEALDGGDILPTDDAMQKALSYVGFDKISVDGSHVTLGEGQKLDLGGVAKGYIADRVIELIKGRADKYGVHGGILSFGGAVSVFGEKSDGSKYKIGIRDPDKSASESLGQLRIAAGHVSVSGDYERYMTVGGEKYNHIIDPNTGYPAKTGVRSVSVICEDGAMSDALSTALFVCGYDEAEKICENSAFKIGAVFVMFDGSVKTVGDVELTLNDT